MKIETIFKKKARKLDQVDCKIIHLLQKDGRIPNTEISKKVGVSEATVRARLNRLIKEKYFQIVAVSNPIMLGFEIVGMVRIYVDNKKIDEVIEKLKKFKSLWYIVLSTGAGGIDAEFVVKSVDELSNLVFNKINSMDGVARTETSLILQYVKRQYDWGTAMDYDRKI
jgi:Lrp/AsnC family transcriptional regulator for asnA, asnC and gidA